MKTDAELMNDFFETNHYVRIVDTPIAPATKLAKGAQDGHPFYGNQYVDGAGGGSGDNPASGPTLYGNANAKTFIESNQKASFLQRMSMDQVQRLAEIYKSSEEKKGAYDKIIQDVSKQVGGTAQIPAMKGVGRASEKIQTEYGGQADRIKDILRSTIVLDNPAGASEVTNYFVQHFPIVGKLKNTLDPNVETIDGYRDAKVNFQVPGDHVGEVQINVKEMLEAKDQAHDLYEERQKIERLPGDKTAEQEARINALNYEMKTQYYDPAWKRFLSKSNATKSIETPSSRTLDSTKSRGGVVSKARTMRPPPSIWAVSTGVPSTSQYLNPSSPQFGINYSDKIVKYAPDQARDKDGKFSSGGDGDTKPTLDQLFSNGLGIARGDMPQIPGAVKNKFLDEQRAQGIKVDYETVPARELKPTQSEYNAENVNFLRGITDRKSLAANPIVVSSDNRILDGHHRWAVEAEVGRDMPIVRVGLPITDLLSRAAKFNAENGIKARTKDDADALAHKLDLFDELEKMETYDLAKGSPDQPRDKDGKWTSGGSVFVSPNEKESTHFSDALEGLKSVDHVALHAEAQQVVDKVAGGGTVTDIVGDWSDGAENSLAIRTNSGDLNDLRYAAALLGEQANQKAVIAFKNDDAGADSMWSFDSSKNIAETRDSLAKLGVEFRSLNATETGTHVQIFDVGSQMTDTMEKVGAHFDTTISQQRGSGEFIGGDTRDAGHAAYREIIADYEATHEPYRSSQKFVGRNTLGRWRRQRDARQEVRKYSPDQPRDADGRFGEGDGDAGKKYAPQLDGETTKAYLKRVVDKMPRPAGGGRYKIEDGNGTYTTLKEYGWSTITVHVVPASVTKQHPYVVALQKRLYKMAIDSDAHEAATSPLNSRKEPTDRMKSAGNYRKGHITINGLDIAIENPAGSRRKPQWPVLQSHYGYVKSSLMESDGDAIDVFVKPQTDDEYAGPVFVIEQLKPDGSFDEFKCLIGWPTKKKAVAAYLENYTPGWKHGDVMMFSFDEFKRWVRSTPTAQ